MIKSDLNVASDMLARFDDSKRAVANLMARENITVQVITGASTATFNATTRILTVPNWAGLTVEQCDLLMSHEIGHALFTDRAVPIDSLPRGLFTYLNCIEDARIERRMKGAFPGLASTFFKGYREFHSKGPIFKGTSTALFNPKTSVEVPVAGMKLIDRINLHYKIGAFCSVPFTVEERTWLVRIDKCSSTSEALVIARELWAAQKDQGAKNPAPKNPAPAPQADSTQKAQDRAKPTKGASDQDTDDQDDSQGEGQGGDQDDSSAQNDSEGQDDSNQDGDGAKGSDEVGTDPDASEQAPTDRETEGSDEVASTVADADDALAQAAQTSVNNTRYPMVHLVYGELTDAALKGRTVTAKAWAEAATDAMTAVCSGINADLDALEAHWNSLYLSTAKHMALEFERKKNARCLAAAKTSKSGKLDLVKLSQYKFTEDLFKRSMVVPNGKSHGIVMLIDGSGSMSGVFANVLDQTLLFAHFAFTVGIAFEAYMFTDVCAPATGPLADKDGTKSVSQGMHVLTLGLAGRLVGLINTTTDRAGFKRQVRAVLAMRLKYQRGSDGPTLSDGMWKALQVIPYSNLSGTPLFTGMMIAERHLARMKNTMKLDKTTFIVVTDGQDTNGLWYASGSGPNAALSYLQSAFVVRDTVTKKNLSYVNMVKDYTGAAVPLSLDNAQLTMLLDIITLRHGSRTVYIYLQSGHVATSSRRRRWNRRATSVSVEGLNYLIRAGKEEEAGKVSVEQVKTALKDDHQYIVPPSMSVADLTIMLPTKNIELTEDEFGKLDTAQMTQKKVAAEFTKAMVKAVSNRKFVNSVVPFLA